MIELNQAVVIKSLGINWKKVRAQSYEIQTSNDENNWKTIATVNNKDTSKLNDEISIKDTEQKAKYVRINCLKRANYYGFSISNIKINGKKLKKIALKNLKIASIMSSSNQQARYKAENIIDSNNKTRWSSVHADNQWVQIELNQPIKLNNITINWEKARAESYEIQTSFDASNWKTIAEIDNKNTNELKDEIAINKKFAPAKYLRIKCLKRATPYGFSIFNHACPR